MGHETAIARKIATADVKRRRTQSAGLMVLDSWSLCQHLMNHCAKVALQSLAARHFQLARVEPQLMQQCRMNIGHIMRVERGMEAQLVGRTLNRAPLDAAARHPNGKAI